MQQPEPPGLTGAPLHCNLVQAVEGSCPGVAEGEERPRQGCWVMGCSLKGERQGEKLIRSRVSSAPLSLGIQGCEHKLAALVSKVLEAPPPQPPRA